MNRFIVEHVTKNKMYVLFSYLNRGYDLEKPEPFNIEEISKDLLEDANNYAIFSVINTDSIFKCDLKINDSSIDIEDPSLLTLEFELESFNLVLDYTNNSNFKMYLHSKEEDEHGFKNCIIFFTDDSYAYDKNLIDIVKIKTYFELFADKKEKVMRLHDCNGDSRKAYRILDEAIAAYEKHYGEDAFAKDNGCCNCSLGIGVDEDGNKWFIVAQPDYFTNCYKQDLKRWTDWYEDEWIEREEEEEE